MPARDETTFSSGSCLTLVVNNRAGERGGPTEGGEAARASGMIYRISAELDILKAELYDRRTAEETQQFLGLVADSAGRHRLAKILIVVRSSNPIFTLERASFFGKFRALAADPSHRVALVGDSQELALSHQYIEVLGGQLRINVRSFPNEPAALRWLRGQA